ncbi:MAG: coenzyme-B sulfoethylthiotransferase subunit beta [Methanosarcinaceae archaeon]|nr:coenzyme-B sulfoethylthiotransferase subunit beta [Methanosarcinaceae archaeon]
MSDTVDLYSDRGQLLESNVNIKDLAPTRNKAIQKIIMDTKRSVAVNLGAIEKAIATGSLGGGKKKILGRTLNYNLVENHGAIVDAVKEFVQVKEGDDTVVEALSGGKQILVQLPESRVKYAADSTVSMTVSAAAFTQAILDIYDTDMYDSMVVKGACWGSYPQTIGMSGSPIKAIIDIPARNEGLGYSMRNITSNHVAAITRRNAMNAAALSSIYEQTSIFEMGGAIGGFERHQLLGLAYQGLNANNMVYEMVKENGKSGTIGSVIESTVTRAIEDKVIHVDKVGPSGYKFYAADDVAKWNAYAAAGTLAATMVNVGSARAAQGVAATMLYFNDILEKETGLPGVDYGKLQGASVGFSFFSHSIYGGGGPGIFNGNHVVTRHSRGFAMPCVSAACALDAGTQMFTIEATSAIIGDVFGTIDEFREPLKAVAGAL